ncbi:Acylamidase [Devosia equisanguinis]|uniref:Acylamidase n=2 Tax=Devosia equisanguinis TaxID=2490941 RepID=A0A3S4EIZ4_9HYPH|nr:Acylamidase [Devosia equisanguinis]
MDRCAEVNGRLNAVVTFNPASESDAMASTARWQAGQALSPLDGVPITIKDNLLVQGLRTTWGSRAFADFVPDADEVPVSRLRRAGLVFIGKTNVPELTLQGYTDNALFGPTGNPWAPDLTPGGSSGGAAAAVAAGIGPLALCTDGGGSIRRPAAHTGQFGFKPSAGAVQRGKGFPALLGAFEVVGPIARSVPDIAAMMNILAPATGDPRHVAPSRILHVRSFNHQPVDPEIDRLVTEAAAALAIQGHVVVTVDSVDTFMPIDRIWPVVSSSGVAHLFDCHPELDALAGESIRAMAETGRVCSGGDYAAALAALEDMRHAFEALIDGYEMMLTPAIAAFSWEKEQSHPHSIAGVPVGPRGHALFTAFANALGLPAITIPTARGASGLPAGCQLIGQADGDRQLLAFAQAASGSQPADMPTL